MKYLVTGTAGFVGFHLAKRLLEDGHSVIGLDNINDYYDVNLKYARLAETGIERYQVEEGKLVQSEKYPAYRFVKMNLEDKAGIMELFQNEGFEQVVNLAAQAGVRYSLENPDAYIQSNIVGFMNILEACRAYPVKHLVYASSSSVYGNNAKVPFSVEDRVDNPVSLYAATKKSNELMAHTYSHLYDIPTTGLRFFTVYGPWGRPDMAPMLFADAITNDRPIKVFNNGEMERDFTYIDDIVEGVVRVGIHPPKNVGGKAAFTVHNIGNSSPVKLMDFIAAMENHLGKEAQKNFMPMQPGDVKRTWADTQALENEVGYKPSTSIDNGVGEFVLWFKEYCYSLSAV